MNTTTLTEQSCSLDKRVCRLLLCCFHASTNCKPFVSHNVNADIRKKYNNQKLNYEEGSIPSHTAPPPPPRGTSSVGLEPSIIGIGTNSTLTDEIGILLMAIPKGGTKGSRIFLIAINFF